MKRLLALLLAVLTVMSLLAGCGKDNETVPDDPAVEDGETLPVDNEPAGDPYDGQDLLVGSSAHAGVGARSGGGASFLPPDHRVSAVGVP